MHTEATPLFAEYDRSDSFVLETRFSVIGLYVVAETLRLGSAEAVHVEVYFPHHRGFALLDEGDMPSWLGSECFHTNHIVYAVTKGGWFGSVNNESGLLAIASGSSKEWLVVTANECVSVFSDEEPVIRELSP